MKPINIAVFALLGLLLSVPWYTYNLGKDAGKEEMAGDMIGACYHLSDNTPLIIKHNKSGLIISCQKLAKDSTTL